VVELIDEATKVKLGEVFSNLVSAVKLVYFTQENACPTCKQQQELLQTLVSLSDKLQLEVYDFVLHSDKAASLRVDKIPATLVLGEEDYGIKFYGLTAGYEFTSLLEAIVMVSTGRSGLDPQLEELVKGVKEDVHIQVFVTLTCPYCPKMVHVAHQFSFINENIRADMIEASEFPVQTQRYEVSGVPKTVINETHSFEGAVPAETAYLEVLKAVNPEKYRHLDEVIREYKGTRRAKSADEEHVYETIIVGGGPAAMSAAIYAVRKGLDVALLATKLGGQINYTSTIDNYLGLPSISGVDMTERFRNHLESFPISEALGVNVVVVKKEKKGFSVITDDDRRFKGPSVIYCAGKEYRRLGVPGEDRFIGKGIGFCATCDAPLFRGKRVAVVGGGNSAFTAVRDLLNFASEIHVIHRREKFTADESLVSEILKADNITFHTPVVVRSFLGKEKLTGIRVESVDAKKRYDLNIDGVFLEIGLTPNTHPLKGLVDLKESGEIPVTTELSTDVEGLFAAGDVTDVREKQISIAVGQGAQAALSTYKYLVEKKLTQRKENLKELWE